eukprot:TRINITY_DN29745_c0_g1_i1.p1 TRINITY_DN29745_c0_g1~~TRINITY_DN29745_c0_g1_i1.p1  ORF type:complete len:696 (+),score=142.66 TRINITY_DN29745_c0_g1_i1:150-2237(+)
MTTMDPGLRDQVEAVFKSELADEKGLVTKESCMTFLQSLGGDLEDVEALLKDCEPQGDGQLRCADFMDVLFGTSKPTSAVACEARVEEVTPVITADATHELVPPEESEATKVLTPAIGSTKEVTMEGNEQAEAVKESEEPEKPAKTEELEKPVEPEKPEEATKSEANEEAVQEEKAELVATTTTQAPGEEEVATLPPSSPEEAEDKKEPEEPPPEEEVRKCEECGTTGVELFEDPTDLLEYCESCWIKYYNAPPSRGGGFALWGSIPRLLKVKECKIWPEVELISTWNRAPLARWPPKMPACAGVGNEGDPTGVGHHWVKVSVHCNPGLVGQWARQCSRDNKPFVGELLCNRYRIDRQVGAGHFTRAYLATDTQSTKDPQQKVCVKRHGGLTVELLTDLLTIGKRIEHVDPEGKHFSRLFDSFFDMVGYTVETLLEGRNCMEMSRQDPTHFKNLKNLQIVALGCIRGLRLLAEAKVVHADMKADNFMWTHASESNPEPTVRLVDFGCSRLDSTIENGRNWAFAEGGAGHIGKWAPEMILRLPITCVADVWGQAVALCELYSGRNMWNCEEDTVEYMLAQALGLVSARKGLTDDLLRRCSLDIRVLYTPGEEHFPVQRMGAAPNLRYKELRPSTWGLSCVLGPEAGWDQPKKDLASFILTSMALDPKERPTAEDMMSHIFIQSSGLSGVDVTAPEP